MNKREIPEEDIVRRRDDAIRRALSTHPVTKTKVKGASDPRKTLA